MTLNPVDFERRVRSVENRASKLWNEIQQTWKRLDQYPEDQGLWYPGYPYVQPTPWPSTTTTTTTVASGCPCSSANDYELTLSGIGTGTGTGCSIFNGTHQLAFSAASSVACEWRLNLSGSATFIYMLIRNPAFVTGSEKNLLIFNLFDFGQLSQYSMDPASFDCDGSNVFSKDSSNGGCTGWPSTITVSKVP